MVATSLMLGGRWSFLLVTFAYLLILNVYRQDAEAIAFLPAYRMAGSPSQHLQRLNNPWEMDYRFINRPRALYQTSSSNSMRKRAAILKRERILDSLGGDYLIKRSGV